MLEFDILTLALLFGAAFLGGFIDSIAGGGGSITLPALLLSGISPLEALATNKLQSSFGEFFCHEAFLQKRLHQSQKMLAFCYFSICFFRSRHN